jgi:hypothetical protein
VDAAAAGTIIAGATDGQTLFDHAVYPLRPFVHEDPWTAAPLLDVGIALYTLGPAGVHAAHGRPLPALASFAARVVAPTAGLGVGAVYGGVAIIAVAILSYEKQGPDFNAIFYGCVVSGGVLGAVAPVLLDALVLARKQVDVRHAPARRPEPAALRVLPRIGFANGMPTIGLTSIF